jgi:hypothetical protein
MRLLVLLRFLLRLARRLIASTPRSELFTVVWVIEAQLRTSCFCTRAFCDSMFSI